MGADGHVEVYSFNKVNDAHRATYSREIKQDWVSLRYGILSEYSFGLVKVDGKVLILRYVEYGTSDDKDTACGSWCEDEEAAERVKKTLESVGPEDACVVWT